MAPVGETKTKGPVRDERVKARWPQVREIVGSGPYATWSGCRDYQTVHLHATLEEARHSKALIDKFGCGGYCSNLHQIGRLDD